MGSALTALKARCDSHDRYKGGWRNEANWCGLRRHATVQAFGVDLSLGRHDGSLLGDRVAERTELQRPGSSYAQLSMGVRELRVILGRMLLRGSGIGVLKGL